ncbi:MAG: genetic competence negative regulator [Bacillaceae bacterium]|nr:genetic competence negative regulator [Bacillaceae bacterium]
MRLERLGENKFKIFVTFDDLKERGFTREDIWHNLPKAHQLFQEMLFEASDELGIDLDGILMVKVHLLQAQGMLIVVTQDDDVVDDEYIEMKVTLDESKEFIFLFPSFEAIIQACKTLDHIGMTGGSLYHLNDEYYMQFTEKDLTDMNKENVIAILSEFSSPSTVTSFRLREYGKVIIEDKAVKQIVSYF